MKPKQINELLKVLSVAGFNAKIWKGYRIYLNDCGRDISAYFELDESDATDWHHVLDGAALKVFTNVHQSKAWKMNRTKEVKHRIMKRLKLHGVVQAICRSEKEVIL
jgi:hypothetical protein